jgi:hypothetical protein
MRFPADEDRQEIRFCLHTLESVCQCACEGVHTAGCKSPSGGNVHPSTTEGYCVVVTRGGELPEVNNRSVTYDQNDTT